MSNKTGHALTMRQSGAMPSILPQSLDEVARFAKMAVVAGLVIVPKKRKHGDDDDGGDGSEGDKLIATATMVILQGMEVGLPPMQALQTIALINGRPLIWGDAVPALLWRAGFALEESVDGDGDKRTARCKITRPDGKSVERTFSVADAKRARLWDTRETVKKWGKNFHTKKAEQYDAPNDSPWYRFSDRMLAMRARGFAVKDGASDVTRGLYLREEYESNEPVDITTAQTVAEIEPPTPDLPQIEAEPTPPNVTQEVEPLPDPDGYCEHLKDQLRECPPEERDDVMSSNQDMIDRLPAHLRKQIDELTAELSA